MAHWEKEIGHAPEKWAGFRPRYFRELDSNPVAVEKIRTLTQRKTATLLYAAREICNALL